MAEDEPAGEPPPGEGPPRRRLPWPARIGPILHGLGVAWVIAGVATTQLGPLGGFLSAAIGVVLSRRGLRTDLERHQEVLTRLGQSIISTKSGMRICTDGALVSV